MKPEDIKKIYEKLDNYRIENIIRKEMGKLPSNIYLIIREEAIKRDLSDELLDIVDKKLTEANIDFPLREKNVVLPKKELGNHKPYSLGRYIRTKEALYNKEEITLSELSDYREQYQNSSKEEQKKLDTIDITKPKSQNNITSTYRTVDISSKLEKLNELSELLKSGTITQEEFDKLKAELLSPQKHSEDKPNFIELEKSKATAIKRETTNSNQKAKLESSTNKLPLEINGSQSKNEKNTFNDYETYSKIKTFAIIVSILIAILLFKNIDFSSNSISNSDNEDFSNESSSYSSEDNRVSESYQMCKICLTSKKESKMSHLSDALSSDFWICNDNNGQCSNIRYQRVREYNDMLRQEQEYKKHSGAPESPFK